MLCASSQNVLLTLQKELERLKAKFAVAVKANESLQVLCVSLRCHMYHV